MQPNTWKSKQSMSQQERTEIKRKLIFMLVLIGIMMIGFLC